MNQDATDAALNWTWLVRSTICVILALTGVCGVVNVRAVEDRRFGADYLVRNWQTEDGLPQNSVSDIIQTRDGYLWLGTFNGLVRFDGLQFTTFNLANSPEMGSDSVNCLFEDRKGRLWIGTEGGLVRRFQDRFTHFVLTNIPSASVVASLAEDNSGTLWVATDGGLCRVINGHLEMFHPEGLPEGFGAVQQLCCDREGPLWIAAQKGLFILTPDGARKAPEIEGATRLAAHNESGVWVLNSKSGLMRWRQRQGIRQSPWLDDIPNRFCIAKNGDFWFCTSAGLIRLRAGILTRYSLQDLWGVNEVMALYEDYEGNLWAGLNAGGLVRVQERVLQTISTRDGLPSNDVLVIMEEPPGRYWIGGYGMGIGVWENGRYSRVPGLPLDEPVCALAMGKEGQIWLGVRDGRLMGWRNGKVFVNEKSPQELARVVFVDREGGLWLGSRFMGVEHRHRDNGQRIRYTPDKGLTIGSVTAITQDKEGAIWVGTKNGLNRIHQGKITQFHREQGLRSDCIHTLLVDKEGILWVGTTGGGLACAQGERFVSIGAKEGLSNEVIGQVLEDDNGIFWLGSNGGILRVPRSELIACARGQLAVVQCQTLNRHSGMINPECAGSFQPACLKAQDGKLWFATVGGVVVIDPQRLATNSLIPPVKIESVVADGVPCLISGDGASPRLAHVPAGTTRVQVTYTGLSFVASEDMRFQFRLQGLDAKWIDVGSRRTAYFNRLQPGQYFFHVKACNNDGVWNEQGDRILLIADSFWWQTTWFRLLIAFGLVFSGLIMAWSIHLRRVHRALEIAEQRSAQIRAAELGAANRQLQTHAQNLETALANVKTLRGLIPICAGCKKIRDDGGYWEQVESYVSKHSTASFSHGLCPECVKKYYPELAKDPPPPNT